MTPERWKRIEDVFTRALDLGDAERQALLDAECAGDGELRGELELMLAGAAQAADSLHETIARGAELLERATVAGKIGSRLGPYRLREILGEGGMGTVYLRPRDDASIERDVAIKICHSIARRRSSIARLRDERQMLASLEHPGIVRLLDGGTTEDGLPYLVMEYIEGVPINDATARPAARCARGSSSSRGSCAALQYAHQKLVVHRDIKPSNILVDADGAPKLLDFGIAKLLDPAGRSTREARTRTGMPMFTAGVCEPGAGARRTGVRRRPTCTRSVPCSTSCSRASRRSSAAAHCVETLAMICERRSGAGRAQSRRPSVRRELAGDLDNIMLKALQKEPTRRYPSVSRWSTTWSATSTACRLARAHATLGYRARKFVRRNRGKLALAMLVAVRADHGDRRLVLQAHRADRQTAEAEREKRNLLRERGIEELALGHGSRALTYFAEVLREGGDTSALRFLIAEAMRPLTHELATVPVAIGTHGAAWSQDGTHIAIAAQDGSITIHSLDGATVAHAGEQRVDYLMLLAFSADDRTIVAGYASGQLLGWDTVSGERRFAVEVAAVPWTTVWAATPRGDAVVAARHDGGVRVIDAGSGHELAATQIAAAAPPSCVAASPDHRHVAIGIANGDLHIWDTSTGDRRRVDGHAGGVHALRYSPDGGRLYSGGGDHAVRVRDAATGQELAVLAGTGGAVTAIDLDRSALRIAALSRDETATIWDARSGALVATVVRPAAPARSRGAPTESTSPSRTASARSRCGMHAATSRSRSTARPAQPTTGTAPPPARAMRGSPPTASACSRCRAGMCASVASARVRC